MNIFTSKKKLLDELAKTQNERDAAQAKFFQLQVRFDEMARTNAASEQKVWPELAKALHLDITDDTACYLGNLLTYFIAHNRR